MSRIAQAFSGGKAFIPFITCGDPDLETTAAAVRAAARHKLLAPEGHAAVAALARPDLNFRFIHKSHTILPLTGASRPRIYVIQTR